MKEKKKINFHQHTYIQITLRNNKTSKTFFFILKIFSITSCTEDHEEDFYYTEVELDSPLDSSGVSSAGQSPMHEPSTNNSLSTSINTSITTHFNNSQPTLKQARKRGPKPRQKHIIVEPSNNFNKFNSTVWMHMDMARPAHEDPEYKYKSRFSNNNSSNNTTNIIKRERKRAASNEYDASDQSDFELNNQQQQNYLQNLTTEQLVKLQQQNHLHLKNNIQHLQQLQKQHQQFHQLQQLQQLHQQVKRKYTKSQQNVGNSSASILMPAQRTKSVICSMSKLDDLDHLLNSTNQNSPNLLKRSKPIKIPGISLAHRDYHQNPNQSSSFTVGSVQLSPTSYFHCFSPTPHSLSSPTSSNSSIYSLGSCNSPGSASIASNSSSNGGSLNSYSPNSVNGQPMLNSISSAPYSPIDTLLKTVENERMAMEDEAIYLINNGTTLNGIKKIAKLKSANVSDLDLVAHNEDEDAFEHKVQQQQKAIKRNFIISNNDENDDKKNELVNQTLLKPIKCSSNSQLIQNNDNMKINKNSIKNINLSSTVASSVIKNGQEALLDAAKNKLTVDCNLVVDNSTNNNNNQNDLQTAQQALVTLASTATNLCNNIITMQSPNKISQSTRVNNSNEKPNSIQNNSNLFDKNDLSIKVVNQPQNNGLLMAANILNQQQQLTINEQSNQTEDNNQSVQAFNYLVSHSGRTIKPTAAAKSYVQRKNRLNTKYMRTQNSSNSGNNKKQNGISKHKTNNMAQFERLLAIEAAQLNKNNNNQNNENSTDLNLVRNSIISSVGNLNSTNNTNNNRITTNETTQQIPLQSVQRTPTGRIRNSGAKCRKTYGMENKYQWCVQCRWKKVFLIAVETFNNLNLIIFFFFKLGVFSC